MAFGVESDAQLAREVGAPATELPLVGVAGAGSRSVPYLLPPGPWDFLLATGRATAAIFSPFRQLFDVSSHWAIVRWFWALDWTSSDVALGPQAAQIKSHHRTAFSEALGLAAGLLLVEHLAGNALPYGIWRGGPMLVDVDSLIPSGKRPDLMVFFGGGGSETYILESKGNSEGRSYSIRQLRSGIEQVLAIQGPAQRLVVGAAAADFGLSIHAITVAPREAGPPSILQQSAEERGLEMELKRLASFAGVADLGEEGTVHEAPGLGRDVVGRRLILRGDNLRADITVGVERQIFQRLGEAETMAELSELRSSISGAGHRWWTGREPRPPLTETGGAVAIAPDGCAISIGLR